MNTDVQTEVISLKSKITDDKTKTSYEQVELREPLLVQVEQFYAVSKNAGGLAGMRTLVSLVGSIPEPVVKNMAYSDFKKCQEYLIGFLDDTPSPNGGS